MTISLPQDLEEFLRSGVRVGRFASEHDAVAQAVRLLRQSIEGPDGHGRDASPDEQAENLRRLCASMEELPTAAVTDGLSNRDHDKILYGERP